MRSIANRLGDIEAAIQDIRNYSGADQSLEALLRVMQDRKTEDAILLALIKIGEAVKALPNSLRARHPRIDWRGPGALRDLLAHRYFSVDRLRIAQVVVESLPELDAAIQFELARSQAGEPDA
jgi:uncharacterized protein with HEPN domain